MSEHRDTIGRKLVLGIHTWARTWLSTRPFSRTLESPTPSASCPQASESSSSVSSRLSCHSPCWVGWGGLSAGEWSASTWHRTTPLPTCRTTRNVPSNGSRTGNGNTKSQNRPQGVRIPLYGNHNQRHFVYTRTHPRSTTHTHTLEPLDDPPPTHTPFPFPLPPHIEPPDVRLHPDSSLEQRNP